MTDGELKQIHDKILEIVVYFDAFCKENNITYYLMGGSALGAIRHKGFIPWDDDFDVFMDYDNYNKFSKVIKKKIDSKLFYFQEGDTSEWPMFFNKLRMNGTTYIEKHLKDKKNMHQGVFIDIMPLNNVSTSIPIRYIQYLAARILNTRALVDNGYSTESVIKKYALKASKIVVSPFIKKILLQYIRRLNKKNTPYVGHFFGRAPFKKTSFKRELIGRGKLTKFEHLSLPVFENVDQYLAIRYGDKYMEMPSEETKSHYPSHAYIVDLKKSYIDYL